MESPATTSRDEGDWEGESEELESRGSWQSVRKRGFKHKWSLNKLSEKDRDRQEVSGVEEVGPHHSEWMGDLEECASSSDSPEKSRSLSEMCMS